MRKHWFNPFAVILLLSSQCNGASFHNSCLERARSSGDPVSQQDMLRKVCEITDYSFKSEELLANALIHHSMPEDSKFRQLEFLGDKVINAVIALQTFSLDKRLEDLNNIVKSKVSNKNLSRVYATLDLPKVRANPRISEDTLAADSFEALVGAIQLDSKGSEHEISPEAARFVISKLCSTKKTAKTLPKPKLWLASENYTNQSLTRMTAENLNTELQSLKSCVVKGGADHESAEIRLVIQLLEQERNHRAVLKMEKEKLIKSVDELSVDRARAQEGLKVLKYELNRKQRELENSSRQIHMLESRNTSQADEISWLRSELRKVSNQYRSLRDAGLVGRIFRRD